MSIFLVILCTVLLGSCSTNEQKADLGIKFVRVLNETGKTDVYGTVLKKDAYYIVSNFVFIPAKVTGMTEYGLMATPSQLWETSSVKLQVFITKKPIGPIPVTV